MPSETSFISNNKDSKSLSSQSPQNNYRVPPPASALKKLEKTCHSEAFIKNPTMIEKIMTKIENKESNFQIFRPKGDLQIPSDSEKYEKPTKEETKYRMYYKMMKPLKGMCIYSFATIQMKLEMDLLISEYFNSNEIIDEDL